MSIALPLYLLFIPYGIFLLVFFFYAFFNLFQLYRHGLNTIKTRLLGLVFIALVGLTLFITYAYGINVDWGTALMIDTISPT